MELMSMNDLIQSVSNPFVEAFAAGLSSRGNLGMNAGRNAQGQLAGTWLVRLISQPGARAA
jgi:hypothetical protein